MKKAFRWYTLLLKARLKKADIWILMGAMFLLTLLISHVRFPNNDSYKVLIYSEDPVCSSEMLEILGERDSIYHFESADSVEALKDDVLIGKAECGFVLAPDYKEKLLKKQTSHLVDYYVNAFSNKGEVAKESFYSAFLTVESDLFLESSINDLFEAPDENLSSMLKEVQNAYLNGTDLFRVNMVTVSDSADSNVSAQTKIPKTYPIRGTIILVLFFAIFMALGNMLEKQRNGFGLYLTSGEKLLFSVTGTLASVTLPAIEAAILLVIYGEPVITASGELRTLLSSVLWFIVFIFYSVVWCLLLSLILRKEGLYMSSVVAVVLLCITLSRFYVDLAEYYPVIKFLRFLLPPALV